MTGSPASLQCATFQSRHTLSDTSRPVGHPSPLSLRSRAAVKIIHAMVPMVLSVLCSLRSILLSLITSSRYGPQGFLFGEYGELASRSLISPYHQNSSQLQTAGRSATRRARDATNETLYSKRDGVLRPLLVLALSVSGALFRESLILSVAHMYR